MLDMGRTFDDLVAEADGPFVAHSTRLLVEARKPG